MPDINSYNDSILPSGGLGVQATDEAFGADVGAGVAGIGRAGYLYATAAHRVETQTEVSDIHVQMAQQRADWDMKLHEIVNTAKPGENIVSRVNDELEKQFETTGQKYQSREGQAAFTQSSASLKSQILQQAISMQAQQAGQYATVQDKKLNDSLASLAGRDHTQVDALIKQADQAYDDPNGVYANVPMAARESLKYAARVNIMENAAKGYAQRFPNAVLDKLPQEVRDAARNGAAKTPDTILPPDLNAPIVKPYDAKKISYGASRVNSPSQYDSVFKAAAAEYNLDWRELKMRAVAESNLDPGALSSQNAGGIMQLTPETADRLGVNRNDPVASIRGAARLIAEYRTKANGDMSVVDKMYYGGESGKAWGPNTKQYAANLASLRRVVGIGSAANPSDFAPGAADAVAAANKGQPFKTGLPFIDNLPFEKQAQIIASAEHWARAADTQAEHARLEQSRQKKDMQDAVQSGFLDRIVNPNEKNGGMITIPEIMQNDVLETPQKENLLSYMMSFAREKASAAKPDPNYDKERELTQRMFAPDGDPKKIYNDKALYDAFQNNEITSDQFIKLKGYLDGMKDEQGKTRLARFNNTLVLADKFFKSLPGSIEGRAKEAGLAFSAYLQEKIDEREKNNQNVFDLYDPTSKDYVLKPDLLRSFMKSNSQALAAGASQVASREAAAAPAGLKVGDMRNGWKYLGGDPANRNSWTK